MNLHSLHVRHLRAIPPEAKRDATEAISPDSPSRFASDRLNARMLSLQAETLEEKALEAARDGDTLRSLRRSMASVCAREAARLLEDES